MKEKMSCVLCGLLFISILSECVVFYPRFRESIRPIRLQGLDALAHYCVKEICMTSGQKPKPFHDQVYSGEYLMQIGLKLTTEANEQSHIYEITKE